MLTDCHNFVYIFKESISSFYLFLCVTAPHSLKSAIVASHWLLDMFFIHVSVLARSLMREGASVRKKFCGVR